MNWIILHGAEDNEPPVRLNAEHLRGYRAPFDRERGTLVGAIIIAADHHELSVRETPDQIDQLISCSRHGYNPIGFLDAQIVAFGGVTQFSPPFAVYEYDEHRNLVSVKAP